MSTELVRYQSPEPFNRREKRLERMVEEEVLAKESLRLYLLAIERVVCSNAPTADERLRAREVVCARDGLNGAEPLRMPRMKRVGEEGPTRAGTAGFAVRGGKPTRSPAARTQAALEGGNGGNGGIPGARWKAGEEPAARTQAALEGGNGGNGGIHGARWKAGEEPGQAGRTQAALEGGNGGNGGIPGARWKAGEEPGQAGRYAPRQNDDIPRTTARGGGSIKLQHLTDPANSHFGCGGLEARNTATAPELGPDDCANDAAA
ncbi:hypothetical protein B0H13DRAFT_1924345 [Mycena leptocephala]|nr:hypothetical protein B0H13DRAFT_1924345 [Mycena leptocephala]